MLLLLLSCSRHQTPPDTNLKADMQAHSREAQAVREAIIYGNLDAVNAAGQLLVDRLPVISLPDTARVEEVVLHQNALTIAEAGSLEEAAGAFGRLSQTCGTCHSQQGVSPTLPSLPEPSPEAGLSEQMTRYHWAAERMWQGLVLASDEAFEEVREAMAAQDQAFAPDWELGELPVSAADLAAAITDMVEESGPEAGQAYGSLLLTCTACHHHSEGAPGEHVPDAGE